MILGGKQYRLRRPASFDLDEMDLVDETMRKVVHRWTMPFENFPLGVSADGTTVYLPAWNPDGGMSPGSKPIYLGVSESGVRFEAVGDLLSLQSGVWLDDHPTDPENSYLSFMRFRLSNKSYIIRFSAPCT